MKKIKGIIVYKKINKTKEDKDFNKQVRMAQTHNFSPFAQYCLDLKGYDLYYNGGKIAKYEAWERGYKSASKIKDGLTAISVREKQIVKEYED